MVRSIKKRPLEMTVSLSRLWSRVSLLGDGPGARILPLDVL